MRVIADELQPGVAQEGFLSGSIWQDVHYVVHEPAEEVGVQATALLFHGQMYDSSAWQQSRRMELMAEKGVRAVAVDVPGFGRSASGDTPVLVTTDKPAEGVEVSQETVLAQRRFVEVLMNGLAVRNKNVVGVFPSIAGQIGVASATDSLPPLDAMMIIGSVPVNSNKVTWDIPTEIHWATNDSVVPRKEGAKWWEKHADCRPKETILWGSPEHAAHLDKNHSDNFARAIADFALNPFPQEDEPN